MTTIAEIRARRAAITPWEWKAIVTEDGFAQIMSGDRCVHFTGDMENTTGQDHADEAFIAAAPADIDHLLATIDKLAAAMVEARASLRMATAFSNDEMGLFDDEKPYYDDARKTVQQEFGL